MELFYTTVTHPASNATLHDKYEATTQQHLFLIIMVASWHGVRLQS